MLWASRLVCKVQVTDMSLGLDAHVLVGVSRTRGPQDTLRQHAGSWGFPGLGRGVWVYGDEVAPPRHQWAVAVEHDLVLAHTDSVALVVESVRPYPSGFELHTDVAFRNLPLRERLGDRPRDPRELVGEMEINVISSTGEGSNLELILSVLGPRRWHYQFWVHPLPSRGIITLACKWPQFGIGDVHVEIPARRLVDGARLCRDLWRSDEPPPRSAASPPPDGAGWTGYKPRF